MSLTETYEAVLAAWTEGRLENVLQRQKEIARLHAALKQARSQLIAAFAADFDVPEASAVEEIECALDGVQQLYDQLDFPSALAKERSIQAGRSAPSNSVALGPLLIQAALPCPISSVILPLTAAVAAGSCCLVHLCIEAPEVSRLLYAIIRDSLDYEAVGLVNQPLSSTDFGVLHFESAVLQDSATGSELATVLRKTNPMARIHTPAPGLPAIFIDRSTPALEMAANWVRDSILNAPVQHSGRMPRLCFVDESILQQFHAILKRHMDTSGEAGAHLLETPTTKEIASSLKALFPSLQKKMSSSRPDQLPRLVVLQSTDPTNPETIGQVAKLLTQSYQGVLLIPTRSLDQGIDLWNTVNTGMSATATYLFGQKKETWYLAQFLKSEHCFINCIPPRSFAMIAPSSAHDTFTLPYRPEDFSTNKAILQDSHSTSRRDWLDLKRLAQPAGHQLSYFEQGLIVGLSVTALAASGLVFAIFKLFRGS
ncbi:uncharacterized protein KD926_005462 [Aspergillus affinis]|uniref:uncharacterized protein n=1 Tax=Aspergillus affinis TaxID=1070780 RepID=UPI0022FE420D|nr:uncharacterized protein KD926_005462 [Aspergillus affinis]KAI9034804.1 hypothetical protein KD926_005462 [Aspergillus affinis]